MSKIMYDYIENYIRKLVPESRAVLKELEEYAKANNVPIVQKETAKFLELMVNIKKPLKILELGTAIGYSAILMAVNSKAHITSIDRSEDMVNIALNNIHKCGLDERINVILGECMESLKKLDDEYDIIFIDAGKGHYEVFFNECLRMLKKDGIVIADNVLFRGMVPNKELLQRRKITIVKRMRNYLNVVSNNKNLITSVIPMGDGIAVTTRRQDCE